MKRECLPMMDKVSTPGKSSSTAPLVRQLLSSNSECRDRVATWGLDQRPPFSTSSSNLSQRAASFHSKLDCSSSISQNSRCGRWSSSSWFSVSPIENVTWSVSCDTKTRETKKEVINHQFWLFSTLLLNKIAKIKLN